MAIRYRRRLGLYVGWQFVARDAWVLYSPGLQDFGKVNQEVQQALLALGVEDQPGEHSRKRT